VARVDPVVILFGGLLLLFFVSVVLLGLFSKRSPREFLDWKPTRSPEAESENEIDDVAQMLEAQNAIRRRTGRPEVSEEEFEERVRRDHEEMRRWRESSS
jgi:hypothetical protein